MAYLKSLPDPANLSDVLKAFPKGLKPLLEFHDAILRGPSPFTIGERELIAAYVSNLNDCRFCTNAHITYAIAYGFGEDEMGKILKDLDAGPTKMKSVLRYAGKLTKDPESVTKADVDAILEAGWPEEAVYDAVAVTALFNYMNRIIAAFGVAPFDELYRKRRNALLKKPAEARKAQNEADLNASHYLDYGKSLGLID